MLEGNYAGFRLEIKEPHIALITFDQAWPIERDDGGDEARSERGDAPVAVR